MGYFKEFLTGFYAKYIARATKMVTSHDRLTVGPNGSNTGSYFNVDGFDKAVIHVRDTGTTSRSLDINWSEDGVTFMNDDVAIFTQEGSFEIPIKAPYMQIYYKNKDTVNSATAVTVKVFLKS